MAPSQSADAAIATLVATARTNRCHNPFFRQQQLKFLHDTLRSNTTELRSALKQDTSITDAEASTEITCVLSLVKDYCISIDPKKELEEEYRVAKGKDAADTKVPWGVAYIEADLGHSPLFSVLSPVAAAVAAGCCVGVKIDNNLNTLPSLLRSLLTKALEQDTFQVFASSPSPSALSTECISVLQSTSTPLPTHAQLVSPKGRVIAIVDRTANLSSAAQNLVNARFAFGGTSPYAPDHILVNEFAKREFVEEVLKCSLPYIAGASSSRTKSSRFTTDLQTLRDNSTWNVSVITQSDSGAIVELSTTSDDLTPLPAKVSTPLFCISTITSLDHGIDLISSNSDDALLAAYHFAAPAHTKYLSQFVKSNLTFANHIPTSLLLGPAAPAFHAPEIERRYTKAQFLRDAPVFVNPSTTSSSSGVKLAGAVSSLEADKQLAAAAKEIKLKKRAEWIAIGFFEQGILIGLGIYGIPLLTCLGASLFFGVRAIARKVAGA